jgi:hypothetical protein
MTLPGQKENAAMTLASRVAIGASGSPGSLALTAGQVLREWHGPAA